MLYSPRPHQRVMTDYMLQHPRCAIWAEMGLGKTSATLDALEKLHYLGDIDHPVLVLAPLRVAKTTWPEEITKWENFKSIVCLPIVGSASQREEILRRFLPRKDRKESRLQVFTCNYENLPWLVEKLGGNWPFRTIVADESTKLKGFRKTQGTARARALGAIAWPSKARPKPLVDRFIELTGTPSPNGLQDLWGQLWFIDHGKRLGSSFSSFEQRWFTKGYDGFSIKPLPHAQGEIEKLLADCCLSLKSADYFDIKEPIINKIYVDLPEKSRKQYKELEKEMYTEIQNSLVPEHKVTGYDIYSGEPFSYNEPATYKIEAFSAAAMTMKCLQMASGALYVNDKTKEWVETHDQKIEALREVVEESAGAPILVAYHFRSDLDRLRHAFPTGRYLDKNPDTITDWNAGRIPLLFVHPASAGHGLNLQHGGNTLVFFSSWWNMEEHAQVIERIGPVRQLQAGFKRPVFLHYLVARGTVDELVLERLKTKRSVQDTLMDAFNAKRREQRA